MKWDIWWENYLILLPIHFLLVSGVTPNSMTEPNEFTTGFMTSTIESMKVIECDTQGMSTDVPTTTANWLEMDVAGGFRIWQLMFLALGGLICVVVFLCCCMKCRIPRTKQEIEADFVRKKLTRNFRSHLNKLPMEDDINFKGALEKVKHLCDKDPSPKKKALKGSSMDEDMTGSQRALVESEKKLSLFDKLKKFLQPAHQDSKDEEFCEKVDSGSSKDDLSSSEKEEKTYKDEDDSSDEKKTIEEEDEETESDSDDVERGKPRASSQSRTED